MDTRAEATMRRESRPLSLSSALLWLGVGMLVALPWPAIWKYASHGGPGVVAAGIAWLLCLVSASAALVITFYSLGGANAGPGLLMSMAIRTGLPLLLGFALAQNVGSLRSVGILGLVLLYYLVALSLETAIAVWMIKRHEGAKS